MYHLPHVWDKVLFNTQKLKINTLIIVTIPSATPGTTSAKLLTHNNCQYNLVAITSATMAFHMSQLHLPYTPTWQNICQQKSMAITSARAL